MKKFLLVFIIFTNIILLSFCKNNDIFNSLYGIWVANGNEENISIFKKTLRLEDNKYGFIIYPDGEFIERNSGWCGTPPLSFLNESGQWRKISENLLKITINREWRNTFQLEIISANSNELKVIYTEEN